MGLDQIHYIWWWVEWEADGSKASDAAFPKDMERAPQEWEEQVMKWWRISRGSLGFAVGRRNDAGLWSSGGGGTDWLSKMANIFNQSQIFSLLKRTKFWNRDLERTDGGEENECGKYLKGVFGVENKTADVATLSNLGLIMVLYWAVTYRVNYFQLFGF